MIDFERVSLKYSEKNYILKDVYFSVKPGGFICVDGKASSGKTSLVKLIGLLKSPTSGRIRLFGRNVSKLNRNDLSHLHKRIGIVFQNIRFIDNLNVRENIILPLIIMKESKKDTDSAVEELLTWLGIKSIADKYIDSLSSIELKIANLARAIISRPKLILVDDFFSGTDRASNEKFVNLLGALNKLGATIVVTGKLPVTKNHTKVKKYIIDKGKLRLS